MLGGESENDDIEKTADYRPEDQGKQKSWGCCVHRFVSIEVVLADLMGGQENLQKGLFFFASTL
jgi:hypothetical protein